MAHFCRYLKVAAMLCLFLALVASAQPLPEDRRQLSFTVFSAESVGSLSYVPRPDATPVPLSFYPTARSPRYNYTGSDTMQFTETETGVVVAEVTVPPRVKTALFILLAITPARPGPMRYRVQVVDDSTQRHEPGNLLILNLSGLELAGSINRKPITLQDGFNGPIRVGESAAVTLRTPFNGRTYQAYAETIMLEPSGRALLLLLPPYRRGSLEVQSRVLLDSVEPKAAGTGP